MTTTLETGKLRSITKYEACLSNLNSPPVVTFLNGFSHMHINA